MKLGLYLGGFVCLMATASFAAGNWSGQLIDSSCYKNAIGTTPNTPQGTATHDMSLVIRPCAPNIKTKSFGLVQQDWQLFEFDSTGNTKAAEFVRTAPKKRVYVVTIGGELDKNILKVDSISMTE